MIIAIMGAEGAGKDEIGKVMQYLTSNTSIPYDEWDDELGIFLSDWVSTFRIRKFATNVTLSYELITGINFHNLPREEKEIERPKYDNFAEGMKFVFGEDVWVDRLFDDYDNDDDWVITDLRFINEYRAVRERKGIVIHVIRGGEESPLKMDVTPDYEITNDGSKEELVKKIEKILIKENIIR